MRFWSEIELRRSADAADFYVSSADLPGEPIVRDVGDAGRSCEIDRQTLGLILIAAFRRQMLERGPGPRSCPRGPLAKRRFPASRRFASRWLPRSSDCGPPTPAEILDCFNVQLESAVGEALRDGVQVILKS